MWQYWDLLSALNVVCIKSATYSKAPLLGSFVLLSIVIVLCCIANTFIKQVLKHYRTNVFATIRFFDNTFYPSLLSILWFSWSTHLLSHTYTCTSFHCLSIFYSLCIVSLILYRSFTVCNATWMAHAAAVTTMPQTSCKPALMDDNAVASDVATVIIVGTRIIFFCTFSLMFLLLLRLYIAYELSCSRRIFHATHHIIMTWHAMCCIFF